MSLKVSVIGSGFSSLSVACYLAKAGHQVHIYEKNNSIGGRARQLKKNGFTFDMGPSWYWMPDVFERFFADFGKSAADYYTLIKLAPAYRVFFGADDSVVIDDELAKIKATFEAIEPGSAAKLERFMNTARDNYRIAIENLVYRPGESPLELVTPETIGRLTQFFSNISADVRKQFKNEKLRQILEFPVLFLGAKPEDTPSFYSFMNFADFGLGTWHPKKGMFDVVAGMHKLAFSLGVSFHTNAAISEIVVENGIAKGIRVNNEFIESDVVVSGADYAHSEQLLPKQYRMYSDSYWDSRVFAPSSLLFYVGFNKKLENINHHILFFDTDFKAHAKDIYEAPRWPDEPLFYANFPSLTDSTCAPEGCEAGFFLVPLAPGIEDTPALRQQYFDKIMTRFERLTKQDVRNYITFSESFCKNDFVSEYNSYKGNAYGMANTLLQTAFLRPKLRSKKVKHLYFTGQLTVPGPGVPPALISGKLTAGLIEKYSNR